jgi:hypothetical protein
MNTNEKWQFSWRGESGTHLIEARLIILSWANDFAARVANCVLNKSIRIKANTEEMKLTGQ